MTLLSSIGDKRKRMTSISNSQRDRENYDENASLNSLKRAFASKNRPVMAWIPRMESTNDLTENAQSQNVANGSTESSSLESSLHQPLLAKRKRPPKGHWLNVVNSRPMAPVNGNDSKQNKSSRARPALLSAKQHVKSNKIKCVPVETAPTMPSSSSLAKAEATALPAFRDLVNYDGYVGKHLRPDGTKSCVMCGVSCQVVKKKKDCTIGVSSILLRDKGVCGNCINRTWLIVATQTTVRICSICKCFRHLEDFQQSERGLTKACSRCREYQRKRMNPTSLVQVEQVESALTDHSDSETSL